MTFAAPQLDVELFTEWMSALQMDSKNETTSLGGRFASLPAQQAVEVFTSAILEAGVKLTSFHIAAQLTEQFFTREDLTPNHVRQLVDGYLAFIANKKILPKFLIHSEVTCGFLSLLRTMEDSDLPTLGSLCRLLDKHGGLSRPELINSLTVEILQNPTCPVEVSARLLSISAEERLAVPWRDGEESNPDGMLSLLREQVAVTHPDLAELPAAFLLRTFATQPIPDAWFEEVWTTPSSSTRPAHLVDVPSPELWSEVMEPR